MNDSVLCVDDFFFISAKEAESSGNNRVLIISHHTSGQIVLKIRGQLRSAGYRVHIDPDMRSGNAYKQFQFI